MKPSINIETLADRTLFKRRRELAWRKSSAYWLRSPLRHVTDVGDAIASRVQELCAQSSRTRPIILDVGCGSAWLLMALRRRAMSVFYVGIDSNRVFIDHCRSAFSKLPNVRFELVDLEEDEKPRKQLADVAVSSFVFFELCDLNQGFLNVAKALRPGGRLLLSVIDKTYLLLALSRDWLDFRRKLKQYQTLPGIKYAFQPIDLGDSVSKTLVYPSVLYSTQDYINSACRAGFTLCGYREEVFTAKPVPKIYNHLEFELTQR
jgi:SAM-dependent methyltransferase